MTTELSKEKPAGTAAAARPVLEVSGLDVGYGLRRRHRRALQGFR